MFSGGTVLLYSGGMVGSSAVGVNTPGGWRSYSCILAARYSGIVAAWLGVAPWAVIPLGAGKAILVAARYSCIVTAGLRVAPWACIPLGAGEAILV